MSRVGSSPISELSSSLSSDEETKSRLSHQRRNRKTTGAHLDSNGESDDEIDKLNEIINEKTRELNEEKQSSKKLKKLVRDLRKENKLLQKQVVEKEQTNSDSENPPWERRKIESQLQEKEKLLQEKNVHIEQLLNDCHILEKDNQAGHEEIAKLTQKLNESARQLQQAAENYSLIEQNFQDRITTLENQNKKLQLQLDDYHLQKIRNDENLDKISQAVDVTVDKCQEIIANKEKIISELEAKLLDYVSSGASEKDEEIRRLRSELQSASEDLEQNARLLEQFQVSSRANSADQSKISRSVLKKLRKLEQIKLDLKECEEMLTERDQQVAELQKQLSKYESGAYGLKEAIKELRDTREQLRIRDQQIEDLIQQQNTLETQAEDVLLENEELRKQLDLECKEFNLPLKRKILTQQLEQCQMEIRQLTDRNTELGLQSQSLKRELRLTRKADTERSTVNAENVQIDETGGDILQDYRSACSEVLVLRKGLMEILSSVREHDGRSDVKIESPILERLIAVLNSERIFGHYDAYADIMSEYNAVQGENRILRERIRELNTSEHRESEHKPVTSADIVNRTVELMTEPIVAVDCATDPIFAQVDIDKPVMVRTKESLDKQTVAVQVSQIDDPSQIIEQYQVQLGELEQQLGHVKSQLQILMDKYEQERTEWSKQQSHLTDILERKEKRLEELESEVKRSQQVQDVETQEKDQEMSEVCESVDTVRAAEKEIFTLKLRLEHKEQVLKRYQQLLDELRAEQLNMIEQHSQEVLTLQDTILDQQRSLHRVEQTQREIAASAASSRVVVRHLESEVDTVHQLHNQVIELKNQVEMSNKQASQWKQAAEALSREKHLLKESLESDHEMIVAQLKNHWESSQLEVKELRSQMSTMKRELLEERYDKQRNTLLHVLITKMKNELEKKEKQMEFLRHIAQELQTRMETDEKRSIDSSSASDETSARLEESVANLQQQNSQLERTVQHQKKQISNLHSEVQTLKEKCDEQNKLVEKLTSEKATVTRQMVSLRSRLTKMSGEKAAALNSPDGVCRLLKRIKDLESQLTLFHQAEKPASDESQQKNQKLDEWKERKKLQSVVDGLRAKLRTAQNRADDEERCKENLHKTINRLVGEKRALEEKLRFKANDNERMYRLIEENTQWRNRFEALEHRLRELSDDETNTDRHRLQISVLQERLKKQEEHIEQLQLQVAQSPTSPAAKTAIEKLHRENVALKALSQTLLVIGPKIVENVQRLDNLIQMDVRPSERAAERRVSIQEGPPIPDIRRTVKNIHQLVTKLMEYT